ncbi:bifunctional riboflavin kinase/FAD synthetase [Leptolyngbya sp. FACHB-261]|uniref:bifunctional riboflavin kinase/FAD synthetase n=1 Tax=Leptolyngbya sp. FACHB-261 TaxID=2692806 RepID=UPI001689E71C|nr:bifunctional riboflavin kinase/FAD synthetase [Leptolyngbya sp. FACHB-261]MBD2103467.1 bifunctional riboflavin kinase/FAD synthetase [Leptolyngbya sp. FACHB-261]
MLVTSSTASTRTPTAVALGNFDGLHRGHYQVIQPVLQPQATAGESLVPTVLSFAPHPQEFFSGTVRPLLTPLPEKAACLKSWGIEQLMLLPFDVELAALSPQEFLERILREQLRAQRVSVGFNFRFGHRRAGTVEDLRRWSSSLGIEVVVVPELACEGERVSSSRVRACLLAGEVDEARRLLGRPYCLTGRVVQGQQLGRTLGFPTANLQVPERKFLPRDGVYCVRATWLSKALSAEDSLAADLALGRAGNPSAVAVMNIGTRPTVNGMTRTVEVHLLNWSGDLYGSLLSVDLERFLRPEQKFDSLEALKQQIALDREAALSYFQEPAY